MSKKAVHISVKLGTVLVCLAAYLACSRTDLYRFIETKTVDYRFIARHRIAPARPAAQIVIVGIDDQTLDRFPEPVIFWDAHFARAINAIASAKPKVIALDVLHLAGPDSAVQPTETNELLASLQNSRVAVVPFYFINSVTAGGLETTNLKFPYYLLPFLQQMVPPEQLKNSPLDVNLKYLEAVSKAGLIKDSGFANLPYDNDGVLRRARLIDGRAHSFAMAIFLAFLYSNEGNFPTLPNELEYSPLPINFAGPPGTFPPISMSAVLDHENDPDFLRQHFAGKVVLLGACSLILGDIHPTPFYLAFPGQTRSMFGVEVNANIISTLISRDFLRYPPAPINFLIIAAGACLAVLVLGEWRLRRGAPAVAGILALYGVATVLAFARWSMVIEAAGFMLFFPLSYLAGYAGRAWLLDRDKRFIERVFSHYLDPRLVEKLARGGDLGILQGRRRDITVLFTDVRGYTTLSEALAPETVVKILNFHLTRLTEIIQDSGGMVVSYAGDAIMAIWNAPLDLPDHRLIACQTALKMRAAMPEINAYVRAQGIELPEDLRIGIGLNSGPAIVGNLGSHRKSDYTAIGDTTNVAARLESMNKDLKTQILISAAVLTGLESILTANPLGPREIRGRKDPVNVYELLGMNDSLNPKETRHDKIS